MAAAGALAEWFCRGSIPRPAIEYLTPVLMYSCPPNSRINSMNFDLDAIQTALDDAESVVFAFKNAREDLSEEVWDNLPDEITEILDKSISK